MHDKLCKAYPNLCLTDLESTNTLQLITVDMKLFGSVPMKKDLMKNFKLEIISYAKYDSFY